MLATTNMSMPSYAQISAPIMRNHSFESPAKQSYLPSSTLVRRSAYIVGILFVFENMRLALEGQSDSLETGRDQPDQHPDLFAD